MQKRSYMNFNEVVKGWVFNKILKGIVLYQALQNLVGFCLGWGVSSLLFFRNFILFESDFCDWESGFPYPRLFFGDFLILKSISCFFKDFWNKVPIW